MCEEKKTHNYECKSCGKQSEKQEECCGQQMEEKNKKEKGSCGCE
jgi:hypothetical protein